MNTIARIQRQGVAGWPDYNGLVDFTTALDSIFETPFVGLRPNAPTPVAWIPALNVFEGKDSLHVTVEAAGLSASDFQVVVENGELSISGERKALSLPADTKAHLTETFSGKFHRVISLPAAVDAGKVTAQYKDGVLNITLPKAEEARRKQIEVKVS